MSEMPSAAGGDHVAAYKVILQRIIDKRPSGMRIKIANALGKHKSFVSQITNPIYPVPVPARHLETIFEICRFTVEERREFLRVYGRAHPGRTMNLYLVGEGGHSPHKTLAIEVPILDDPERQAELEDMIRQFARRIGALATRP
jgi:hypothetical protein